MRVLEISEEEWQKLGESKEVLLYFADKGLDFLLAMLGVILGYYITKWLDGRK